MPSPTCNCGIGIMVGSKIIKGRGWIRNCPTHGIKAREIKRQLENLKRRVSEVK